MADAQNPSQMGAPIPGEQWSLADQTRLHELFHLLAIPSLTGYAPVAITAVGVVSSPTGEVAHYPVYAQLVGAQLAEKTEVYTAIAILQGWVRTQQRERARGSTRSDQARRLLRQQELRSQPLDESPRPTKATRLDVTVKEQENEESTPLSHSQSAEHPTPTTRRVRPPVAYYLGRPAQSWVDALARGHVTLVP